MRRGAEKSGEELHQQYTYKQNSLVGIRHPHPFLLRHRLDLVYLVAFYPAALYQIPGVSRAGDRSRTESWTPAMKAAAREFAKKGWEERR